ncbi:hypothetical protein [Rhodococcus wratislaviensis]|uniref:hypothetical protein n=1 Tax=Rhodococcus wratislaviensis TaxID=44752 RepID=UPI0020D0D4C4|nr:hypothetical protein [Rhodococcus wratislaviensis]
MRQNYNTRSVHTGPSGESGGCHNPRMNNSGRVDVLLGVRAGVIDNDSAGPLTANWADHLLQLERPVPHVCAVHGEPEVDRRETTLLSGKKPRSLTGGDVASAGRYTVSMDWPVCVQCIERQRRWRKAALATLVAFLVAVIVLFIAAQSGEKNEGVLSLTFFAAFGLLFGAAKLNQRATLFTGATLNADGTAVVVAQAHPEFARQV